VGKFFNDFFINVKMDMEQGEGPELSEQLQISAYPTLFFVNGDGVIMHKYIGSLNAEEFISLGMDAINPEKQQYHTKESISTGKMLPASFHSWIHNVDSLTQSYLAHTSYPLLEKEMLAIIFDHAESLNKAQLDVLFKNRNTAARLMKISMPKYDRVLVKKISKYAYGHSFAGSSFDFVLFKKTIANYYPAQANFETRKTKVSYYGTTGEAKKCLAELSKLISTPSPGLLPNDLTKYVLENIDLIMMNNAGKEFIGKVSAYKVPATFANEAYFKDLTLVMLYYMLCFIIGWMKKKR
jgi:hypothetical protein